MTLVALPIPQGIPSGRERKKGKKKEAAECCFMWALGRTNFNGGGLRDGETQPVAWRELETDPSIYGEARRPMDVHRC